MSKFSLNYFNLLKEEYKMFLGSSDFFDQKYKWESLANFQENWNLEADDFLQMYDASFHHRSNTSVWKSHYYKPKEMMMEFIKLDPMRCKHMFEDLFYEDQDVEKRINFFRMHCDDMLMDLQKSRTFLDNHFHDDAKMISAYLAFRYPDKYTIVEYSPFKQFMKKIKSSHIPSENELGRYFKLSRTFNNLILKDEELMSLISENLYDTPFRDNPTTLLVHDFYRFCDQYDVRD